MRISDWSSDVCSSDLDLRHRTPAFEHGDQRVLESAPGLLVVARTEGSRRYLIISNLTDHEARYRPEEVAPRDLLATSPTTGGEIVLAPHLSAVPRPRSWQHPPVQAYQPQTSTG